MPTERDLSRIEDLLHRATVAMDAEKIQMADEIKALIPDTIRRKIARLEKTHKASLSKLQADVERLSGQLKEEVLELGESWKGDHVHVIYNRGVAKWNNQALQGYGVAHPEIMEFYEAGKPFTSIRPLAS